MRPARLIALLGLPSLALALASVAAPAIVVTDFAGREVGLESPASRIVALAPHAVENAFSAGAGSKLVGAVEFSDFPQAARAIPRVGSAYAWSLESVIALQPDLVLMWGSGNGNAGLAALERMGLPVYISEPRTLGDVPRTLRDIGTLAGTSAQAEQRAAAFEQSLAQLGERYRQRERVSVFYEVWHEPLQTLGGQHMVSDVIRLCGGSNIFNDASGLAPRVSQEAVLGRDPEVIIGSGMNGERPEWLDAWRAFPSMQAVAKQALFFIHPDLLQRPTLRLLGGARQVCELLESQRN